jgi:hypothetical protein
MLAAVAFAVVAASSHALVAEEETLSPSTATETNEPQLVTYGQVGLGSPLGALGGSVGWVPIPWLAMEGGAGWDRGGVQLSTIARAITTARTNLDLGIGFGLSLGGYEWGSRDWTTSGVCWACEVGTTRHWDRALWANIETSVDQRFSHDLSVRAHLGVGRILNPADSSCEPKNTCATLDGVMRGYVALSLGHVFFL